MIDTYGYAPSLPSSNKLIWQCPITPDAIEEWLHIRGAGSPALGGVDCGEGVSEDSQYSWVIYETWYTFRSPSNCFHLAVTHVGLFSCAMDTRTSSASPDYAVLLHILHLSRRRQLSWDHEGPIQPSGYALTYVSIMLISCSCHLILKGVLCCYIHTLSITHVLIHPSLV